MLDADIAGHFFSAVRDQGAELMSREHFSVDGTLVEAWASMKSFRSKDDDSTDSNGWGDFRGHKRSNQTHQSKTDPEARLMRKGRGREAKLSFGGHALVENRHGLLVDYKARLRRYVRATSERPPRHRTDGSAILGHYDRLRRRPAKLAKALSSIVCVHFETNKVSLDRSSSRPAFDRLAISALKKATALRTPPKDVEHRKACYRFSASFGRVPPLPLVGCNFDEVLLTLRCFYPFKKLMTVSVTLFAVTR
jgi:hypothetical protein